MCVSFVLRIYIVPLTVSGLNNLKGKHVEVVWTPSFPVAAVIQSVTFLFIIVKVHVRLLPLSLPRVPCLSCTAFESARTSPMLGPCVRTGAPH